MTRVAWQQPGMQEGEDDPWERFQEPLVSLLERVSRRSGRLRLGNVEVEVNPSGSALPGDITVATGTTTIAMAGALPYVFQQFVLPWLRSRDPEAVRMLDVSSSAGLAGLLLGALGARQVDLFSRSSFTRSILRHNVERNRSRCAVLDALDPARTYDLIIADAFETASPAELRGLGGLLAAEGLLVLFGFPAAYFATLREHLGKLWRGWRNESCAIAFPAERIRVAGDRQLPSVDGSEADRRLDFQRRLRRWVRCFQPFEVEPCWRIGPPGMPAASVRGEVSIRLFPSLIFGTGSNTLTQLILQVLPDVCQRLDRQRDRVLDLGCGSGILALAVQGLGIQRIDAMDVDEDALAMTRLNAALNGVDIQVLQRIDQRRRYRLVVANLFGPLHFNYLPIYQKILQAGGLLLMAGFDQQQEAAVGEAYEGAGYGRLAESEREGWKVWLWQRTRQTGAASFSTAAGPLTSRVLG